MVAPDSWISDETPLKLKQFRDIMAWHAQMVGGMCSRNPKASYLYIDCHAGPGCIHCKDGEARDGSPLIMQDILYRSRMDFATTHFENDPDVAAWLADALYTPKSPTWPHDMMDRHQIVVGDCETELPRWCEAAGYDRNRYGVVFSDPPKGPIPVDALNVVAAHFRRVDLLAYVAANDWYKRANATGHGHGKRLADDIAAIKKDYVLIREPSTAHQWTFFLFTNWKDFPEYRKIGFVQLDSTPGRKYFDEVTLTDRERRERNNTPLPFGDE